MKESRHDPGCSAAALVILSMAAGTTCSRGAWEALHFLNLSLLRLSVRSDLPRQFIAPGRGDKPATARLGVGTEAVLENKCTD